MSDVQQSDTDRTIESLTMPEEIREDMQKLIATAAGAVWSRTDGLDSRARSLATMAMLTALGRKDELAIHIRLGQTEFGVTRSEICELIMHAAIYSGFPAAISGLRVATRVFAEMDAD